MHDPLATVLGSAGVAILLLAFFLNLRGRLPATAPAYKFLNLVGAGLACASSALIAFVPFVVLEGTWAVVAALSLVSRRLR